MPAVLTEIVSGRVFLRWKSTSFGVGLTQSKGTPHAANHLLKRVRDFARIMGDGLIIDVITDKALTMLDVDHEGFETMWTRKSFVP